MVGIDRPVREAQELLVRCPGRKKGHLPVHRRSSRKDAVHLRLVPLGAVVGHLCAAEIVLVRHALSPARLA